MEQPLNETAPKWNIAQMEQPLLSV
jgi:hypothetical protein